MIDAASRLALKWLAGSPVPAAWFHPKPPARSSRTARTGTLHIEIVSHCWQYSRLLAYQLTSVLDHPITAAKVTLTVYYSSADADTARLLAWFGRHSAANVTWNWVDVPPRQLFRRSIGRNRAALASKADWVWFTDCDMTFQSGCIDSLSEALQGRTEALVYPRLEAKTDVYTDDDLVRRNSLETPQLLRADLQSFKEYATSRATGPLQITHGDVARAMGYCKDIACYQREHEQFQKATEDRVFRWLLGTQGTPIHVDGVCRIQHAEKGRYGQTSRWSLWRQRVRRWQHRQRENA